MEETYLVGRDKGLEDTIELRRAHVTLVFTVVLDYLVEGSVRMVHVIHQVFNLTTSLSHKVPHLFAIAVALLWVGEIVR